MISHVSSKVLKPNSLENFQYQLSAILVFLKPSTPRNPHHSASLGELCELRGQHLQASDLPKKPRMASNLVASLLLVVRPGAPSSVLAPSSDALSFLLLVAMASNLLEMTSILGSSVDATPKKPQHSVDSEAVTVIQRSQDLLLTFEHLS